MTTRPHPSLLVLPLLLSVACVDDAARGDGFDEGACAQGKCDDGTTSGETEQDGERWSGAGACAQPLTAVQCEELLPDSPVWSWERPTEPGYPLSQTGLEPTDPLFYVNRWSAIDPCFKDPPDTLRLPTTLDRLSREVHTDYTQEGWAEHGLYDRQAFPTECDPDYYGFVSMATADTEFRSRFGGAFDIRQDAWDNGFGPLLRDARDAGEQIRVVSGFRTAGDQVSSYGTYFPQCGDSCTAHPLHSEHQLGTAADLFFFYPDGHPSGWTGEINSFDGPTQVADQVDNPTYRWMRSHAHEYGIVLTYPAERSDLTQYRFEPWHYRYVGHAAAEVMHACHWTTEELLRAVYEIESVPEPDAAYSAGDPRLASGQTLLEYIALYPDTVAQQRGLEPEALCWFVADE